MRSAQYKKPMAHDELALRPLRRPRKENNCPLSNLRLSQSSCSNADFINTNVSITKRALRTLVRKPISTRYKSENQQ